MTKMNALPLRDNFPLVETVERLIERHGQQRMLLAVLRQILRRRDRRPQPLRGLMSDHIRRDLGLPPLEIYHRRYWEIL